MALAWLTLVVEMFHFDMQNKREAQTLEWLRAMLLPCSHEMFEECWYPFSWHIFYEPDSTKPDFFVGSIHVLHYILFFQAWLKPMQHIGGNWESVV